MKRWLSGRLTKRLRRLMDASQPSNRKRLARSSEPRATERRFPEVVAHGSFVIRVSFASSPGELIENALDQSYP
jgi:hypothetical protein